MSKDNEILGNGKQMHNLCNIKQNKESWKGAAQKQPPRSQVLCRRAFQKGSGTGDLKYFWRPRWDKEQKNGKVGSKSPGEAVRLPGNHSFFSPRWISKLNFCTSLKQSSNTPLGSKGVFSVARVRLQLETRALSETAQMDRRPASPPHRLSEHWQLIYICKSVGANPSLGELTGPRKKTYR